MVDPRRTILPEDPKFPVVNRWHKAEEYLKRGEGVGLDYSQLPPSERAEEMRLAMTGIHHLAAVAFRRRNTHRFWVYPLAALK